MRKTKIIALTVSFAIALTIIPTIVLANNHKHTGTCYGSATGTPHTHDGSPTKYGECYSKDISLHDCGGSIEWKNIGTSEGTCPKCKKTIEINYYSGTSNGCNGSFSSTIFDRCECGYKITQVDKNEKVAYPETKCKYRESQEAKYQLTCTKEEGAYYDSNGNKLELACSKVVISIDPLYPDQTTMEPNFTLKATYLDGHTAYINPTNSNYDETQAYKKAPIKLEYSGEVKKVGNQGTLYATVILTKTTATVGDDGLILDPGLTDTTTSTLVSPTVTPTIKITPIPTPTETPQYSNQGKPDVNVSNNGGSGNNSGGKYNSSNSNGNKYTGNGNTSYKNNSIANNTNSTIKENDEPNVGTIEQENKQEQETQQNVPTYEYIKRNPIDIMFTTEKEVTPSTSYGVLNFSENVRNEKNDTVGTKKDPTPTPSPIDKPFSTLTEQPKEESNNLIYIVLIFLLICIILAALSMWFKTRRKKNDGIEAKHMNLSDRLNP